jgi:hypothetical protein
VFSNAVTPALLGNNRLRLYGFYYNENAFRRLLCSYRRHTPRLCAVLQDDVTKETVL